MNTRPCTRNYTTILLLLSESEQTVMKKSILIKCMKNIQCSVRKISWHNKLIQTSWNENLCSESIKSVFWHSRSTRLLWQRSFPSHTLRSLTDFHVNGQGKNTCIQECIPVGCVPPAAVAVTGGSPPQPPRSRHPPQSRQLPWPDPPQLPPWVWAWTRSPSISPLAVGLDQIPLNFPLGCGPGDPPGHIPLNFPLGCGPGNLQGMLGCHPPPRWDLLQGMLGYHLQCMLGQHPPVNRITDTCKNITFPQLCLRAVTSKNDEKEAFQAST